MKLIDTLEEMDQYVEDQDKVKIEDEDFEDLYCSFDEEDNAYDTENIENDNEFGSTENIFDEDIDDDEIEYLDDEYIQKKSKLMNEKFENIEGISSRYEQEQYQVN